MTFDQKALIIVNGTFLHFSSINRRNFRYIFKWRTYLKLIFPLAQSWYFSYSSVGIITFRRHARYKRNINLIWYTYFRTSCSRQYYIDRSFQATSLHIVGFVFLHIISSKTVGKWATWSGQVLRSLTLFRPDPLVAHRSSYVRTGSSLEISSVNGWIERFFPR